MLMKESLFTLDHKTFLHSFAWVVFWAAAEVNPEHYIFRSLGKVLKIMPWIFIFVTYNTICSKWPETNFSRSGCIEGTL